MTIGPRGPLQVSFVGGRDDGMDVVDAIVTLLLDKIDDAVLARAPKLRVIAHPATHSEPERRDDVFGRASRESSERCQPQSG